MLNASLIDVPRPFLDPIDSLVEALGILALAVPRPLCDGSLVLAMDSLHRGLGMVRAPSVTPTVLHHVVGMTCAIPSAISVVIVSVRSRGLMRPSDIGDLACLTKVMRDAGLSLRDWVIVGRGGLYCPRSIAGWPDPWVRGAGCL